MHDARASSVTRATGCARETEWPSDSNEFTRECNEIKAREGGGDLGGLPFREDSRLPFCPCPKEILPYSSKISSSDIDETRGENRESENKI